ncbi:MAG: ABC transporter permease [Pseudomonadales bacterium]|jgi:putative ABC transport system permease protein|nr:ABC transporter permease [Pseudomonadales bacterium]
MAAPEIAGISWRDSVLFALLVLRRYRFRTSMMLLAMTLAVGSVVAFTALGEGARGFVRNEFSSLGTDLLVVLPGRKQTTGGAPPVMGTAARDVTLADLKALRVRLRGAQAVVPLMAGKVEVSANARARDVMIIGSTAQYFSVRELKVMNGSILPEIDDNLAQPVCVIGGKVRDELFGNTQAVGEWIKMGDRRFRIIGVLSGKADASGFDLSDGVLIPVASAQMLFNRQGLFRVIIEPRAHYPIDKLQQEVLDAFRDLHQGEEDVTVVKPDSMMQTFDKIFTALTLGVGAIAGISLLVAGVLVMNLTLISVSQRTKEIGLLKALGASNHQIRRLFLLESVLLCMAGALCGVVAGELLVLLGRSLWPNVPFAAPAWAVVTSVFIALFSGVVFAWLPASRAARQQPVDALAGKMT